MTNEDKTNKDIIVLKNFIKNNMNKEINGKKLERILKTDDPVYLERLLGLIEAEYTSHDRRGVNFYYFPSKETETKIISQKKDETIKKYKDSDLELENQIIRLKTTISQGYSSIERVLKEALDIFTRLQSSEDVKWIRKELQGYKEKDSLSSYRNVNCILRNGVKPSKKNYPLRMPISLIYEKAQRGNAFKKRLGKVDIIVTNENFRKVIRGVEIELIERLSNLNSRMKEEMRKEFSEKDSTFYNQIIAEEGFIESSKLRSELNQEIQKFNEYYPIKNGKRVFIMMRYKGSHKFKLIEEKIREELKKGGFQAILAKDKTFTHESVWRNVCVYMFGCETGIAVLEQLEDNFLNPNILIELGFMLSLGKDCLVVKEKQLKKLPTDIIARIYKKFDGSTNDLIKTTVTTAIEEWIQKIII